jgi:hypothetical protein
VKIGKQQESAWMKLDVNKPAELLDKSAEVM